MNMRAAVRSRKDVPNQKSASNFEALFHSFFCPRRAAGTYFAAAFAFTFRRHACNKGSV